jgi:FkbM family methyltransferase
MSQLRTMLKRVPLFIHLYRIVNAIWLEPLNRGQRLGYTARYLRWYLLDKPAGRSALVTLANGLRSKVYADSDSGVSNLFTRNVDFHETAFIRAQLTPGDYIVDAGCNVGNRTLALADIISGALMLDANPVCIERVGENFGLNQIDISRYTLVTKAVSDTPGVATFSDLGSASCQNQIVAAGQATAVRTRDVAVTTVDGELAALGNPPVRYIKVDCEGFDLQVLRGASQTLRSGTVAIVEFERWATQPLAGFQAFFADLGWTVFAIDDQGRPSQDESLVNRRTVLLAMPADRLASLT